MANRHTLHISKLEDFKKWLVKDGWEIEEPKGIYEVLRARKLGRKNPLIIYTKSDAKEHLSLMDRDSSVVGAFLRDCKKPKTNADRIRAMSDEELANILVQDIPCKICVYWAKEISSCNAPFGFICTKGYAAALIQKWLQSEVEE